MKIPVVLHEDPDSDYGVTVPDAPGCFSCGDTIDEALVSVLEALSLHCEGVVADGGMLPQCLPIETHKSNPDFAGGMWAVVDFDITPYITGY